MKIMIFAFALLSANAQATETTQIIPAGSYTSGCVKIEMFAKPTSTRRTIKIYQQNKFIVLEENFQDDSCKLIASASTKIGALELSAPDWILMTELGSPQGTLNRYQLSADGQLLEIGIDQLQKVAE